MRERALQAREAGCNGAASTMAQEFSKAVRHKNQKQKGFWKIGDLKELLGPVSSGGQPIWGDRVGLGLQRAAVDGCTGRPPPILSYSSLAESLNSWSERDEMS